MGRQKQYAWIRVRVEPKVRNLLNRLKKANASTLTHEVESAIVSAWERHQEERRAK